MTVLAYDTRTLYISLLTLYAPGRLTVAGLLEPEPPVTLIWAHSIYGKVSGCIVPAFPRILA